MNRPALRHPCSATSDGDDRLRLDYDQTTQLPRTVTDIRFKLIAFVPTIAAASVGFFGKPRPAVELLAIGLLGMTATLGILVYELRNSQIYAAAAKRPNSSSGGSDSRAACTATTRRRACG